MKDTRHNLTLDAALAQPPMVQIKAEIEEALRLFDAGLNVFPVKLGCKEPYGEHGFLTTTRLYRPRLAELVTGSNLAVMTGLHSGNLVVLDCDSIEDYQRVENALVARGLMPWVRNSVRGGQFWLRCADGEVANAHAGDIQVLGNRLYTIAPPSIHPSGMLYEWRTREGEGPPVVTLGELSRALPFLSLRPVRRKVFIEKHEKPSSCWLVADKVLKQGDISDYASNSEAENAACLSLMGLGYSDEEILEQLRINNPPHFKRRGEDHFRKSILDKARLFHQSQRHVEAIPHSLTFIDWATSRPWPGRTGNTDRSVYLALCQRMRMDAGMPFRASVREVSELAGIKRNTAHTALKRLLSIGLVLTDGRNKGTEAARYRLKNPMEMEEAGDKRVKTSGERAEISGIKGTVGSAYTPVGDNVPFMHTPLSMHAPVSSFALSAHDAWHPHALGKSALACWSQLLGTSGLTLADIAARTGKHRSTVSRALEKLKINGLARRREDGLWDGTMATEEKLNKIAEKYCTLGRAALKSALHRSEREKWASEQVAKQIQKAR